MKDGSIGSHAGEDLSLANVSVVMVGACIEIAAGGWRQRPQQDVGAKKEDADRVQSLGRWADPCDIGSTAGGLCPESDDRWGPRSNHGRVAMSRRKGQE